MSGIDGDSLPEGWASTILNKLGFWSTGGTPYRKKTEYFGGEIPWVKSGDLTDGHVVSTEEFISQDGLENSAAKLLPVGSLLIALYGATIGKLGVLEIEATTNQACAGCQVNTAISETWYVFYYLMSQRQALIDAGQGGAQPNLTNGIIRDWPISLPPLAEQRRIVAKVEELLARVRTARQRLSRIPTLLKRFRQSILTAACNGNLTADWREENSPLPKCSNPNLKAIELHELPESWSWNSLESLCNSARGVCYGVIKLGAEVQDGIPCLRTSDLKSLRIDSGSVKRISIAISENFKRTVLEGGEVLVAVRGTLGGVAVVPHAMRGWNVSREISVVPINSSNPHYVSMWISSQPSQNWLSEVAKGVAYTGINLSDLRLLPVPVPPMAEQHEIVRRVDALFKLADAIEHRVTAATTRADKLTQAILAKAFRGQLVPTEADLARAENRDYETAAQLLERLSRSSENTPSLKSKNGRIRRKRDQ